LRGRSRPNQDATLLAIFSLSAYLEVPFAGEEFA